MESIIESVQSKYRKKKVVEVRTGDVVRVSQRIKEGSKERVQVFEGLVIRTRRSGSLTSTITVRRIASGVGVEKTFMLHSPLVEKVEVVKRSKVRRKYLSYMRERGGKSARLAGQDFDRKAVNSVNDIEEEPVQKPEEATATKEKTNQDAAEGTDQASENDSISETAEQTDKQNKIDEKVSKKQAKDAKDIAEEKAPEEDTA